MVKRHFLKWNLKLLWRFVIKMQGICIGFLFLAFFLAPLFSYAHPLQTINKDTSIVICNETWNTSNLNVLSMKSGKWTITEGIFNIANDTVFKTTFSNVIRGSYIAVWSSKDGSELVLVRLSNRKALAKILPGPLGEIRGGVTCLTRLTLNTVNPQKSIPTARGRWTLIQQPLENNGSAALLSSTLSSNGDTISTNIYNLNAPGTYSLNWIVTDPVCGNDTAKLQFINRRNIANILTTDKENQPTCAAPVLVKVSNLSNTSVGNWRIGSNSDPFRQPVVNPPNGSPNNIEYTLSNFQRPGTFDFWWVVSSASRNECPADSQRISVTNIKPLAETEYTSQVIDVCGLTQLKAKNPALNGGGLSGRWILKKMPSNAPAINAVNLTYNSTINFAKPGLYYLSWVVQNNSPLCISDTAKVVFNNIRPATINAGRDSTICSTTYPLKGQMDLEGLTASVKSLWSVYYQPAQVTNAIFDNEAAANTTVRNLNTIGLYGFVWIVTTSTPSLLNCSISDSIFISSLLHKEFTAPITASPFCDTLKLLPPVKDFASSRVVPLESWKVVEEDDPRKLIKIITQPNNSLTATGFSKPSIYRFEYCFNYGGCIRKAIFTTQNLKASPISLINRGQDFCKDSIQLTAPSIEFGYKGLWENVFAPAGVIPRFVDGSKINTWVKEFISPGAYKFRWVLYPIISQITCLRYSDTILYTNQKASALPVKYLKETDFCGPMLKLISPKLDPDFKSSNTGWSILGASSALVKVVRGDTTIFSNFGAEKQLKVTWNAANTVDPSCVRVDTIIRVNQQPMVANSAGGDLEVCGKKAFIAMSGLLNPALPSSKGRWSLVERPLGAPNPQFLGDSSQTNLKLSSFSMPGVYKFRWTVTNLSCVEKDEVLITNSAPDTIWADATNRFTCKSFDSLRGTNLKSLPSFKNARYSWRIISQPPPTSEGRAVVADSTLPTGFISRMLSFGIYSIEYSIRNGGCIARDTATIVRSQVVNAVVTKGEYFTCEDSVVLEAIPEANIPGKWVLVSGALMEPNPITANGANAVARGLTAAEANVFDWKVSAPGCEDSRRVVVKKYTKPPNLYFEPKTLRVCESDFITLRAMPHTAAQGTAEWYFNGIKLSNKDSCTATGLQYGSNAFRFRLVQGDETCASKPDILTVQRDKTFDSPVILSSPERPLCADMVNLHVSSHRYAIYKWTSAPSNPTKVSGLSEDSSITASNLTQAGTYKIYLQVSKESCIYKDSAVVIRDRSPSPARITNIVKDMTICEDEARKGLTFDAETPAKGSTGRWIINSFPMPNDTLLTRQVSLGIDTNLIRWSTSIPLSQCVSYDDRRIVVLPSTPISRAGNDRTVYSPSGSLEAIYGIADSRFDTRWIPLNGSLVKLYDSSSPNTGYNDLPLGTTGFVWKIKSSACRSEADTVYLTRLETKIPKGFSPNNDRINENFLVAGIESYGQSELTVFNKWGDIVYENKNYNNEWKGESLEGKSLPDDTYYYILKLGSDKEIKNYVVIKR